MKTFFFFLESTCACVLGPWPWPRAFLSLASRVSVLGKAGLGLGLGFFLCPWPWPRALCPRLHLYLFYCTFLHNPNCRPPRRDWQSFSGISLKSGNFGFEFEKKTGFYITAVMKKKTLSFVGFYYKIFWSIFHWWFSSSSCLQQGRLVKQLIVIPPHC